MSLDILRDLIRKDHELGRVLFFSSNTSLFRSKDDGLNANFAFVHDPNLPNDVAGNVKTIIEKEDVLFRIAIKDLTAIENIANFMIDYCKEQKEKQLTNEAPE